MEDVRPCVCTLSPSDDDVVAEGDKVVTRYTMRGIHTGALSTIPATGKKVVMNGVVIDKVVAGKVVEDWEIVDTLGVLTQLGVIPAASKN